MIILVSLGYSFCVPSMRYMASLRSLQRAQNEFDVKIKRVRSDNGTEFKNTNIEEFFDEEGIKHEFLVPYTPQQNGVVERKNRTLIEAARAMLDEYKTSVNYWAEGSTQHVMLSTAYIFTRKGTRPPMNF